MFLARVLARGEKPDPLGTQGCCFFVQVRSERYAVKKIIEAKFDTNLEASPENETNHEDLKNKQKVNKRRVLGA